VCVKQSLDTLYNSEVMATQEDFGPSGQWEMIQDTTDDGEDRVYYYNSEMATHKTNRVLPNGEMETGQKIDGIITREQTLWQKPQALTRKGAGWHSPNAKEPINLPPLAPLPPLPPGIAATLNGADGVARGRIRRVCRTGGNIEYVDTFNVRKGNEVEYVVDGEKEHKLCQVDWVETVDIKTATLYGSPSFAWLTAEQQKSSLQVYTRPRDDDNVVFLGMNESAPEGLLRVVPGDLVDYRTEAGAALKKGVVRRTVSTSDGAGIQYFDIEPLNAADEALRGQHKNLRYVWKPQNSGGDEGWFPASYDSHNNTVEFQVADASGPQKLKANKSVARPSAVLNVNELAQHSPDRNIKPGHVQLAAAPRIQPREGSTVYFSLTVDGTDTWMLGTLGKTTLNGGRVTQWRNDHASLYEADLAANTFQVNFENMRFAHEPSSLGLADLKADQARDVYRVTTRQGVDNWRGDVQHDNEFAFPQMSSFKVNEQLPFE
jgi:hypothetical protein